MTDPNLADATTPDQPPARRDTAAGAAPVPGQGAPDQPTDWTQPPAASASGGWAQPPGTVIEGRTLYGSTEARVWKPNAELAASAAAEASARAAAAAAEEATRPPVAAYAPVRSFTPTVQRCPRCGGNIDWDGYCETCGAKAPNVREHFTEQPSEWVAGMCDRGIRHSRNEDALALEATGEAGGRAALVVADGVSMSADSDKASMAASKAALQHLVTHPDFAWELTDLAETSQVRQVLGEAVQAANRAVLDNSDLSEHSPASCTLAIGLVNGRQLLAVTLGDSRVYWLPDTGAATLLSTDDSMAQEEIASGIDRQVAESGANSHVITRWLGRDAPDLTPSLSATTAESSGWLMVCTDGLWNYSSDPEQMARLVRHYTGDAEVNPLDLARALVEWANEQGGQDNITVALARIVGAPPAAAAEPVAPDVDVDAPTTRIRRVL